MKLSIKLIALVLCLGLMACALSGCGFQTQTDAPEAEEAINVYATFYPIYALAELIVEDVPNLKLNCLAQPMDGSFRTYGLSDWDLALLAQSADAVISGGRGLESFASTLYALGETGPAVASVLYNLELATVEPVNETGEDSDSTGVNPHIYISIDGAIAIAERIAANMSVLDPEYGELYSKNLENAKNRLESLREEMHALTGDLRGRKVIVMNEALIYTAQEFDLDVELYYARESGSALYDKELEDCIAMLTSCEARVILIEKQAPEAFCKALEAAGFRLVALDVLSTRRADEGAEGYFEAQRANARALAEAYSADADLEVKE